MKIVLNNIHKFALSALLLTAPLAAKGINTLERSPNVDTYKTSIPINGSNDISVLIKAPDPKITIAGEEKVASIVVDIKNNILYRYNRTGHPIKAYPVATGKTSTPTKSGIRIVDHIEKYPYKYAYGSKRKRNPKDYGPYILILNILDVKTGKTYPTGQFIHGCRHESSIGKKVSHGCTRLGNEVITNFAIKEIKPGDLVVFTD